MAYRRGMDHASRDAVADAIHRRRTCKTYTGEAVPRAALERALELARWAPSHRLTEPWRFYVLGQPGIQRLAAFLRIDPAFAAERADAKGSAKIAKLLERLPGAGALVLATWVRADVPAIDLEEHAAAAAAVQNLLLAFTADGFGTYWSTSRQLMDAHTLRWAGADPDREGALGWVWVGRTAEPPPTPPRRPLEERVRWVDAPA